MDAIQRRKMFQRLKSMTQEQFYAAMDVFYSDSYVLGEKHWKEAIYICLPPRYRKAVEAKVKEIRGWDGVHEKVEKE